MKKLVTLLIVMFLSNILYAQFDIRDYRQYLMTHKDMSFEQLLNEYPAGLFKLKSPTDLSGIDYFDSIDSKYNLTTYEKELIQKHGFMVTERLQYGTFQEAMYDIYHKDLPVYLSADAILHAIHFSFDKILEDFEQGSIINVLEQTLLDINNFIPQLINECSDSAYIQALRDLDVYINVPLHYLSHDTISPNFPENQFLVNKLIQSIEDEKLEDYKLFSSTPRTIDFSQFQPRGHYARNEYLIPYFKAMMWLGRIEIYVKGPIQQEPLYIQKDVDINRQTMMAALLSYSTIKTPAIENLNMIEELMQALIGEQDNLTIWEIDTIMNKLGIDHPCKLADRQLMYEFRSELFYLKSQSQLINSQILYSDVNLKEQADNAYSVCLMGQRGTIDAYILSNVVFDKILYKNEKVQRFFPKTLDLLFSIGNDAAIQLLEPELKKYNYSMNLAGLRYLIDGYDTTFWNKSYYTNWLHAIKTLNPPGDRDSLQGFMQTAAWWQKTMNTQLASWAELRHDFILYSKQSYSSDIICSFPYSYIEPVPEFYNSLFKSINKLYDVTQKLYNSWANDYYYIGHLYDYLTNLKITFNQLVPISDKELKNIQFDTTDINFLKTMININRSCADFLEGWYMNMFYDNLISMDYNNKEQIDKRYLIKDYLVADFHTVPDTSGNGLQDAGGFVMHAGVGPINMAVITAKRQDGQTCAYIGPVMSYYEHITKNFKRLTDEEWETIYSDIPSYKPAFTNLYMADTLGNECQGVKEILYTIPSDVKEDNSITKVNINLRNHPNPFSNNTLISFSIPSQMTGEHVELSVYDTFGRFIKSLQSGVLSSGNYIIKWDGTDEMNREVNPGVYLYTLNLGNVRATGKMSLIR